MLVKVQESAIKN